MSTAEICSRLFCKETNFMRTIVQPVAATTRISKKVIGSKDAAKEEAIPRRSLLALKHIYIYI